MNQSEIYRQQGQSALSNVQISKVLRSTYILLAMTLLFSTITAVAGIIFNMPYLGLWTLLPYIGLLFMVERNKNNSSGIFWVFGLTGWLGLTIGPIIGGVIGAVGYGPVVLSLGGTALIFFATSAFVLITGKDMSGLTKFITVGILVAFIAGIANVFLNISGLGLAVSSMFLVLSSLLIMWQTSAIIRGGETNYISATVTLYVSIYNIFLSLLNPDSCF